LITIETAQEWRSPSDRGPIEQVALCRRAEDEAGNNSNVKARKPALTPAEPITMDDRQARLMPDNTKLPAPALQFKNDYAG
jgi:hypothetical protein